MAAAESDVDLFVSATRRGDSAPKAEEPLLLDPIYDNPSEEKRKCRCWGFCFLCFGMISVAFVGILFGFVIFWEVGGCGDKRAAIPLTDQIADECRHFPWRKIRLPTAIRPFHYFLRLHPDLKTFHCEGIVEIQMNAEKDAAMIVLHQHLSNLSKFDLRVDNQSVPTKAVICDPLNQWAFIPENPIRMGSAIRLRIEYRTVISQNILVGLYANNHLDNENNIETVSAVTQFEPTHARRVFPCFDEPSFKAVFELAIIRQRRHQSRANMPLIRSESLGNGLFCDYFAPTLRMSTYIMAFAVLNGFQKISRMTLDTEQPIEVNVFASTPNFRNQSAFALETAIRSLGYFENFFGIPFPLQKTGQLFRLFFEYSDLLALDDFAEGAMENWGLMTFRDMILLYEEGKSTEKGKEQAALVVAHEVAHQWFGNYVTMEWWNDLWLNEGFANFMEFLCVQSLFPEWNMADFFVENTLSSLIADGFESSHPVSTEMDSQNPSEVNSIFDVISYNKGAAILQMIRALIGPDAFRRSLRRYLRKFAFSNARRQHLWTNSPLNSSLLPFVEFAEIWTTKVGYPVVSVSLDGSVLILQNQTRFLYLKGNSTEEHTEPWPIPIHYRTNENPEPQLQWFRNETVRIQLEEETQWAVLNADAVGFFRVLYSEELYSAIGKQLRTDHRELSVIDRAHILNDLFAFAKSGLLEMDTVLDIIQYLEEGKETERTPWIVVIAGLRNLENLIGSNSELLGMLERFERSLVLRTYEQMSWENPEDHATRILQPEVLSVSCRLEIDDCIRKATVRFRHYLHNKTAVHVDIHPLIVEEGIRRGTANDWEQIFQQYLHTHSPAEKQILLMALTMTTDVGIIHRLLRFCLDDKIIRPNVLPRVIGALMQNRAAAPTVWHFFLQNFPKLQKILGGSSTLLGTLVKTVIENFSTQFELNEVIRHFGKLEFGASKSKFDQALENIKLNIQWRKLNEKTTFEWLRNWHSRFSIGSTTAF